MENILQRWRSFFQKKSDRISEILYVPSKTGSHDVGAQYLGDLASSYLEHQNLPEAGRLPFRGIKLSKRVKIYPRQVACHLEELNCQNGNCPKLETAGRGQVKKP